MLALLTNQSGTKTILELGTHFGLSGAYLISQNKIARLFTIEGCPETAAIARETFELLGLTNRIHQQIGSFDEILPSFQGRNYSTFRYILVRRYGINPGQYLRKKIPSFMKLTFFTLAY